MKKEYIQIGKDYRLTSIGGLGSNFYQAWKVISGGSYRKCNLQITVLNKIDFIKSQYILHMIINQFVGKKLSTRGYIVSPEAFKEFQNVSTENVSTENIVHLASELNSDESITIFHKTK